MAANQHPDHDTISTFRQRHLLAFGELFTQALLMCEKAGMVKLGHVAIDGTKLKANASKHKAMSYERMSEKEKQLREEVEKLLAEAAKADANEDAKYGPGKRIDELPKELARRESRLKNIVGAKAELEQEAKEQSEAEKAAVEAKLEERRKTEQEQGRKMGGRAPQVPDPEQAKPKPKAQRNFTDNALSSSCANGFAHHEGRRDQGIYPGLQCTGGGGQRGANHRGECAFKFLRQRRSPNRPTTSSSWCRWCRRWRRTSAKSRSM